jgi:hypothetical protein
MDAKREHIASARLDWLRGIVTQEGAIENNIGRSQPSLVQ